MDRKNEAYRQQRVREAKTTHGMSSSKEYRIWRAMRDRCNNSNQINYANYGGRGIKVCERWMSFDNFYADMGDMPSVNHSLERVNNNAGYEPSNVRWATAKEQNNNRRTNRRLEYQGKSFTVAQLADMSGQPYHRLYLRLFRRHWSLERAMSE